jgi:tetratricopeptide (TPR) repeat protein
VSVLVPVLVIVLLQVVSAAASGAPAAWSDTPRLSVTEGEENREPAVRDNAWSEFALGVFLMESGNVVRAVDHLENSWRLSGRNVQVGLQLADAYFIMKNFARCEIVVDDVLIREKDHYAAMVLKAKIRYIKRDPHAAMDKLEQTREVHGSRFEVERLLGNIAYEAGDIERALEAYSNCIRLDPSYPYIQFRYGALLAQELRYEEAENAFLAAVRLDPGFAEPALQLAEMYAGSGRMDKAVSVLEDAFRADRSNGTVLIALSEVYLQTGRLDDGIRMLEERKNNSVLPRDAEVLRGRFYYEAGEYREAYDVFSLLLDREKDNPELARILGEISLRAGNPERSLYFFDMAIDMDKSDYRSYLGKFLAATPSFNDDNNVISLTEKQRSETLDTAAQLVTGSDFDGNYLIGVCYLSIDEFEPAKTYLLRANTLSPDDHATLLNLANTHEKLKEFGEAEKYLARLYELNPGDPTVCNFYGYLLAEMRKDLEFAETLIRAALQADPENGYYLDSLGWVYYQKGEYSKAVIELEKASTYVSDDPVILEHLGDAYRALRRMTEARTAYQKSSRLQDGNQEILEKIDSTDPESD